MMEKSFVKRATGQQNWLKITDSQINFIENICSTVVTIVHADPQASLCARTSAGTVMTYCGSCHI